MNTSLAVVESFNLAFTRHDLDTVMALMTEDCIFENTYPAPDGTRHTGQTDVRQAFANFFESSPHATFVTEEIFAAEDRCVVRWIYQWQAAPGQQNHIRGVDVFRVQGDRVAEKLSYVKG